MTQIASEVRLNCGCGEVRRPGYIGVDARPSGAADYVLPAWDTSPWPPGSIDEVYSRHMLEHLDPGDARRTLEAWHDVLQPGGLLHIILPDLKFHARQLLGEVTSWSQHADENFQHAICSIYGWRQPICGGDREDAHRWGYTYELLHALLTEVGFAAIERVTTGEDSEPWHLNVIARKPSQN